MPIESKRPLEPGPPTAGGTALVAIYDLAVSPASYDIVPFLVAAEIMRRRTGSDRIHFVLVPSAERSNDVDLASLPDDAIAWRLRQIVIAATALMPSVRAVSLPESRMIAQHLLARLDGPRFPEHYTVERPIAAYTLAEVEAWAFCGETIPVLSTPPQARIYVARWIETHAGGRRPVSITMRDADHAPGNNDDREAWFSFLASVDRATYFPFVIRDTDRVFEVSPPQLDGIAQFPQASVNIELRAAAYELSYLNLMGTSGPAQLLLFGAAARGIVFNVGSSGSPTTTLEAFRINCGLEKGQHPFHVSPYHRWVWAPMERNQVTRYFDLLTRFIESGLSALNGDEQAFFVPNREAAEVMADRMFSGRQWGPAKTLYRHLAARSPKDTEFLYRLGVAETWSGDAQRGLVLLQQASDAGLANSGLFLARCEALMFLGRMDQALANARYALELDPDSFDAALRLGLIYESHGHFDEAQSWLERALTIRPDSHDARAYLEAVMGQKRQKSAV